MRLVAQPVADGAGRILPLTDHEIGQKLLRRLRRQRHVLIETDAVAVEPVSTFKFPANWEINREFCQIWSYSPV